MKVINIIQDVGTPTSCKHSRDDHNDNPLVVTIPIDQCVTQWILIDTGSSANILFWDTFTQMGIS